MSAAPLRAAIWTRRSLTIVRRNLRAGRYERVDLPTPPAVGRDAVSAVQAVLRSGRATCLERSLVMQRWLRAQGDLRDVVIGVTPPGAGFSAHAWLEGEPPLAHAELTRVRP